MTCNMSDLATTERQTRRKLPILGIVFVILIGAGVLMLRNITWGESFAGVPGGLHCPHGDAYMLGVDLTFEAMPSEPEGVLDVLRTNGRSLPEGDYEKTMSGDRGQLRHRNSDGNVDAIVGVRLVNGRWAVDGVQGCGY